MRAIPATMRVWPASATGSPRRRRPTCSEPQRDAAVDETVVDGRAHVAVRLLDLGAERLVPGDGEIAALRLRDDRLAGRHRVGRDERIEPVQAHAAVDRRGRAGALAPRGGERLAGLWIAV